MKDPIFYPDRTPAETAKLYQEGKLFFETAVRRHRVDPIFYPDRTPEETFILFEDGKVFFESVIRRKK